MKFAFLSEDLETNQVIRYQIQLEGHLLTYAEVLELWCENIEFRNEFTKTLVDSPFAAFRWETPALTAANQTQPFEFVLVNAPRFENRQTDSKTYQPYFKADDSNHGIVVFNNLGGDATLIVPSPLMVPEIYGHLASFLRNAPAEQVDALWSTIGKTVHDRIEKSPLWLNTAGGGVAWLHVRLDYRPKYYSHWPYKTIRG